MGSKKIINEYMPSSVTIPGETLIDLLEEKGLSQAELAKRMGRPKKTINEIIKGKATITPETAIQLEKVLGVDASFWNNRQRRYDEYKAKLEEQERLKKFTEWSKGFPINEMIKNSLINNFTNQENKVSELLKFFGVSSPLEWKLIWDNMPVRYRQSLSFKRDLKAVSVWLRKGEIEATKINCNPYNKNGFLEALKEIKGLTRLELSKSMKEIIKLTSNVGVAVVIIPRLKGVPVYGVTRWLSPDKALLQFSLRGKFEDIFWFTFFHEAGHILLHGKRDIFIEENDSQNKKEKEADAFARNFLIPKEEWERFISLKRNFSPNEVQKFSRKLNICPAIVVGRLQFDKYILNSYLNEFKRKFESIKFR